MRFSANARRSRPPSPMRGARLPAIPRRCAVSTHWSAASRPDRNDVARMTRKGRRLLLIGMSAGVLALAAALVLTALTDSIVFFNSPTDVVEKAVKPGTRLRLGGLVKPG